MLFDKFEDYETAAFIGLGVVFWCWERSSAAHSIDRLAELKRDLLALFVLFVAVGLSRAGLRAAADGGNLTSLAAQMPWRSWPVAAQIALALLFADFTLYWMHRLIHTKHLWRTHRWHHSIEHMYWFSGLRTSALHGLLYAIPQVLISFCLFSLTPAQLGLLFGIGIFVQFWSHSNLSYDLGPLAWLIITPQYHRAHHAATTDHGHGNYGQLLTLWDRWFGTFVDPRKLPADYRLGLAEPARTGRMLIGL